MLKIDGKYEIYQNIIFFTINSVNSEFRTVSVSMHFVVICEGMYLLKNVISRDQISRLLQDHVLTVNYN